MNGSRDIYRAFVALARQSGLGAALGVIAAALLVPGIPSMRDKAHGYTSIKPGRTKGILVSAVRA